MEFTKQYLSYAEYISLGGSLQRTPFDILELEARKNIDKYTFGRLIELTSQKTEVKICVFKLIGLLDSYSKYESQNKSISSENIDGYSISYLQSNENISKAKTNEIANTIKTFLSECRLEDGTPYLYVGGVKW